MEFILNMEISDFISQFIKLKEKETEQKVWEIWLAKLPNMTEENFVSYDEMLNLVKGHENNDIQSYDEIYVDQCFF